MCMHFQLQVWSSRSWTWRGPDTVEHGLCGGQKFGRLRSLRSVRSNRKDTFASTGTMQGVVIEMGFGQVRSLRSVRSNRKTYLR